MKKSDLLFGLGAVAVTMTALYFSSHRSEEEKEEIKCQDELRDAKSKAFDHANHLLVTDINYIYNNLRKKGKEKEITNMISELFILPKLEVVKQLKN